MHNGEALYASNAGKLNGLAPEAYIQPQESLFINWNFKNPVNQQNKTNYTEIGYCIDMWYGGLAGGATTGYSLSITSNGLVLLPLHFIQQTFEQVSWEGEFVTFALLMDGMLYTASWKWNKDAEYELIANFRGLLIRYSGKYKYIQLLNAVTDNFILQAAKAEKGAIFTGWPVWNYALELAKCQRYALEMVRNLKGSASIIGSGSALTEQQAVIFIPTPISLRTDPSVRFNGNIKLVLGSDFWANGINVVSASIQNSSSNGVSIYANVNDGLIPGNWYHLVYMDGEISSFYFNANL